MRIITKGLGTGQLLITKGYGTSDVVVVIIELQDKAAYLFKRSIEHFFKRLAP